VVCAVEVNEGRGGGELVILTSRLCALSVPLTMLLT